ncbi:MAG: hypothetical protein J6A21_13135 [Lentisphaeria bacterium]|nr:hypothetical protein [Lentisphaeria bacterium]
MNSRKKMLAALIAGLVLAGGADVAAQFPAFGLKEAGARRNKGQPTNVKAESMDIDINNNRVTLIGNVDVDDQDMNIKCRKMILFFAAAEKKKDGEKKKNDGEEMASRKIEKIECIGDVEITRSTGTGKDRQLQKAYAGKAVYSLVENKISLTEKPVVTGNGSVLNGEFITIDTQTGRISVLRPDSRIVGGLKGAGLDKVDRK